MEVGSSRRSRTGLLTFRMIWSGGIFFEMRDSQRYRAGSTIKGDIERACGVLFKRVSPLLVLYGLIGSVSRL